MAMKQAFLSMVAAVALPLWGTGAAHAAGVVNGGFETGDFTGWTVTGGLGYTGVDAFAAMSGSYGAYFGEDAPGSSISQTFATTAGASYTVDFWVQLDDGAVPNAFSWSWNGVTQSGALSDAAGFAYAHFSAVITSTGPSATLQFNFTNPQSFYLLDDVSVSAVPEPTTHALLLLGGLALAGSAARRRHAAR